MNKSPIDDLTLALSTDPAYRQSWIDNISICFQDEYNSTPEYLSIKHISDLAAERFLKLLTTKTT